MTGAVKEAILYTSGSGSGLVRKSGLESRTTLGWHWGLGGVCALWVFL